MQQIDSSSMYMIAAASVFVIILSVGTYFAYSGTVDQDEKKYDRWIMAEGSNLKSMLVGKSSSEASSLIKSSRPSWNILFKDQNAMSDSFWNNNKGTTIIVHADAKGIVTGFTLGKEKAAIGF